MGLSGATKKQRIQDDPRNLRWAQDTSAPGFRLLASMGWDPTSNPSLGNSDSQAAISAMGGSGFSKKISSIPIAKEDNLGIGMKRGSAASVVGSLKAMGVPGAVGGGIGSGPAKVSGFVTAGSGATTPNGPGSSSGGEFGGLLARLNKLKEQGSLVATPVTSDSDSTKKDKKRKRSGSTSSDDSSSSDSSDSDSDAAPPVPVAPAPVAAPAPAAPSSYAEAILRNPRMASRSKHLRAKRMATASNASAMAEILGLAPTPSPSTSGASTPVPTVTPALAIAPPSTDGWPVAPPRGTSAMVQETNTMATATTTTIQSTRAVGAAPMFASASTTTLAATFDPTPSTSSTTLPSGETDKERRKREKAEKKARKEEKKSKRADEGPSSEPKPTRPRTRSPSPAFVIHSAKHDPFHVSADVETAAPAPQQAAGIYKSMFVSSSTGGMGATWTPPTDGQPGKVVEDAKDKVGDVKSEDERKKEKEKKEKKEKKDKKDKKDKREKKDKKRKAEETIEEESKLEVEGSKKETKEEKAARKEAKRQKKEAKAAKRAKKADA
ncbi:hypothetical protein JCM10212_003231 [Sporobolomyces blumeae]